MKKIIAVLTIITIILSFTVNCFAIESSVLDFVTEMNDCKSFLMKSQLKINNTDFSLNGEIDLLNEQYVNLTINSDTIKDGRFILLGKNIYISPNVMRTKLQNRTQTYFDTYDSVYLNTDLLEDTDEKYTTLYKISNIFSVNYIKLCMETLSDYKANVKKTKSGIELNLNNEEIIKAINNVNTYIQNNPDKIYTLYRYFIENHYEEFLYLGSPNIEKPTKEEYLKRIDNTTWFFDKINWTAEKYTKSALEKCNNSNINVSIEKLNNDYIITLNINYDNITINGRITLTPQTIDEEDLSKYDTALLRGFDYKVDKVYKTNNPPVELQVKWYQYDLGFFHNFYCKSYNVENAEVGNIYGQFLYKNDIVMLPLRKLAEELGEKVGWNNERQQAFITQNGQNIYVNGTLYDTKTYVNPIEFEKFGYKVELNKNIELQENYINITKEEMQ